MKRTAVHAPDAPPPNGPYSQAIRAGGLIFLSAQLPKDPRSGELPDGIAAQTKQVIQNLAAVLAAAGATLDDVVRTTVYLVDLEEFAEMNRVYESHFGEPKPARTTLGAPALRGGARVLIDAIAVERQG